MHRLTSAPSSRKAKFAHRRCPFWTHVSNAQKHTESMSFVRLINKLRLWSGVRCLCISVTKQVCVTGPRHLLPVGPTLIPSTPKHVQFSYFFPFPSQTMILNWFFKDVWSRCFNLVREPFFSVTSGRARLQVGLGAAPAPRWFPTWLLFLQLSLWLIHSRAKE